MKKDNPVLSVNGKQKKGIIYCVTNKINNKKYIGQTITTLKERRKQHMKCVDTRNHPFYLALRKYKDTDFKWEVIEDDIDRDALDGKERYYINFYNSQENGYNATNGGNGRIIYKKEDEKKIIELYSQGKSCYEIGIIYKVSYATIGRTLLRNNIKLRRDGNKYEQFDKEAFIQDYFDQTLSNIDLSNLYNVDRRTIERHAKRLNLPSRRLFRNKFVANNKSQSTRSDECNSVE